MQKIKKSRFLGCLVALGMLSACGGSGLEPNRLSRVGQEIDTESINVVVELPTEVLAVRETLADTVELAASTEATVAELQTTIEALTAATPQATELLTPTRETAPEIAPAEGVSEATNESLQSEPVVSSDQPPAAANSGSTTIIVTDASSLNAKIAGTTPDENGEIAVTITEEELNNVLANSGTRPNAGVSGAVARLTGGMIIFEADVTRPTSGRLILSFLPYVNNGALQFEIVEVSLDGNRVPPAMIATAEATLNSTLGEALNQLPNHILLVDIIIGEGTMTMIGQVQN